jgi:hypothetical protein
LSTGVTYFRFYEENAMPTKQVYVDGSLYYYIGEGAEIKVSYDHSNLILFTVPADMDIEGHTPELNLMVIENATERVHGGYLGSIALDPVEWVLELNVHNVGE